MNHSSHPAFSLVEVALAIGIVGFTFVALLGILPVGLQSSRSSMDTTLHAQIIQEVCSQVQLSSFSDLQASSFSTQFPKNYDDQGIAREDASVYSVTLEEQSTTTLPSELLNPDLLTLRFAINSVHQPGFRKSFSVTVARKEPRP